MIKVKRNYQQRGFSKIDIPILKDIPIIGKLFFQNTYWTSFLAIFMAIIVWYIDFQNSIWLRLRSVGEHPMAADTMGINVTKMRYLGVMISGALGGIGGGVYAQSITSNVQPLDNQWSGFYGYGSDDFR